MRQAFTTSQPVSDARMFAGRHEILSTLIRSIEDQKLHVVLYGDRGIGKTSLLHVLAQLATEARYVVCYKSCSESSDFTDTIRSIAREIPQLYLNDVGATSDEAESGAMLADRLPAGALSVLAVSELFAKLSGTRILIILDEFDRSDSELFRREIAELIKNLSDRSTRLQLVIAGVAANLSELLRYIPSIRRNIIGLPMPNMSAEEVQELIRIGEAVSGLSYSSDATALIVTAANGSPYLASLLGQHAGLAAIDDSRDSVSCADVVKGTERALGEVRGRADPQSLYDVESVTDPELLRWLTVFAGESLSNIGQILRVDRELREDKDRASALEALSKPPHILEENAEIPGHGYRFREEGIALFVWLRRVVSDMTGPV
jgi:hypothetical protein